MITYQHKDLFNMQQTLCIIKPDGIKRNLIGDITSMIEKTGFKIVGAKMLHMSPEQARLFYIVHKERPFYQELVDYMMSGPVMVYALHADNAVARFRDLIGHTDPKQASDDTIRKVFGISIEANTVHGSDSDSNAAGEIGFFFHPSDIVF